MTPRWALSLPPPERSRRWPLPTATVATRMAARTAVTPMKDRIPTGGVTNGGVTTGGMISGDPSMAVLPGSLTETLIAAGNSRSGRCATVTGGGRPGSSSGSDALRVDCFPPRQRSGSRYSLPMSDSLNRLYEAVLAAKKADAASSRTARLLRSGRAKMAKKLAEEAVEVVIDAMHGNRDAVVRESADLLYNLIVLWVSSGVRPEDVWAEMKRRERLFGIAEKLPKDLVDPGDRRKVVALEDRRRLRKRR